MNAVAEELTGWTADEHRPAAVPVFMSATRTPARRRSPAERVLRDGDATAPTNRTVLVCRDGRARAISDSAAPIRDASDTTRGVVLVSAIRPRRARPSAGCARHRRLHALARVSDAFAAVATSYQPLLDLVAARPPTSSVTAAWSC